MNARPAPEFPLPAIFAAIAIRRMLGRIIGPEA